MGNMKERQEAHADRLALPPRLALHTLQKNAFLFILRYLVAHSH